MKNFLISRAVVVLSRSVARKKKVFRFSGGASTRIVLAPKFFSPMDFHVNQRKAIAFDSGIELNCDARGNSGNFLFLKCKSRGENLETFKINLLHHKASLNCKQFHTTIPGPPLNALHKSALHFETKKKKIPSAAPKRQLNNFYLHYAREARLIHLALGCFHAFHKAAYMHNRSGGGKNVECEVRSREREKKNTKQTQ